MDIKTGHEVETRVIKSIFTNNVIELHNYLKGLIVNRQLEFAFERV